MMDTRNMEPEANWVETRLLGESLLPAHYAKEYLDLVDMIQKAPDEYVALADRVRFAPMREEGESTDVAPDVRWALTVTEGHLSVTALAGLSTPFSGSRLPEEAVVVWLSPSGRLDAKYWSNAAYGAAGFGDGRLAVLISCDDSSPAWLAQELQEDYCRAQIARAASGSVLVRIAPADLLAIKVRLQNAESRQAISRRVTQLAANERERLRLESLRSGGDSEAALLLTGSTLEERLQQFDAYAVTQGWCDSGGFFVEAASQDADSDLFIVRRVDGRPCRPSATALAATVSQAANEAWRRWYWDSDPETRTVFLNSLGNPGELPSHLIHRTIGTQMASSPPKSLAAFFPLPIPSFGVMDSLAAKQGPGMPVSDLARDFFSVVIRSTESPERTNPADGPISTDRGATLADKDLGILQRLADDLFKPYRELYRPLVAIRITSNGRTHGAYLFFGEDQFDEPDVERAKLEGIAARILPILHPRSDVVEEATRSESLRRLSWLMHRIHGPLGRIASALDDLQGLAVARPDIATLPIPDDAVAARRASMPGRRADEFTFAARTDVIAKAVDEIRTVGEKIRRLRSAQSQASLRPTSIAAVVARCLDACSHQFPEMAITREFSTEGAVNGNPEQLEFACSEVLNNAVRELQCRAVAGPRIAASVWEENGSVWLSIRDNGLPTGVELPKNPFAEDSSSYAARGQGSGLGLAVVAATVRAMAGRCYLKKNQDSQGVDVDGVTFLACAPLLSNSDKENADV